MRSPRSREDKSVCNLYSVTTNEEAIRGLAGLFRRHASVGNFPPMPAVFPDYPAPIVRNTGEGRELAFVRWGMPTPQKFLEGKKTDPGVTNVRNVNSSHWRRWLGVESRCVVPFTSFSEFDSTVDDGGRKRGDIWFAFDESRPVAMFAGIWAPQWKSVRKLKEGEIETDLCAFLTTEPNDVVGAIHPKAMPVILTERDEIETWLTAPWEKAKALQRPLPSGLLRIVAVGKKADQRAEVDQERKF